MSIENEQEIMSQESKRPFEEIVEPMEAIETEENLNEYGEGKIKEIEGSSKEAIDIGVQVIESGVKSTGGGREDIKRGQEAVASIQNEITTIAAEAQKEIKKEEIKGEKEFLISATSTFEELKNAIDQMGDIRGSDDRIYDKEKLKKSIDAVSEGRESSVSITRSHGLREKVEGLIENKIKLLTEEHLKEKEEVKKQRDRLQEVLTITGENENRIIDYKGKKVDLADFVGEYEADIKLADFNIKKLKNDLETGKAKYPDSHKAQIEMMKGGKLFSEARLQALNMLLSEKAGKTYQETLKYKSAMERKFPAGTKVNIRRSNGEIEKGWVVNKFEGDEKRFNIQVVNREKGLEKFISLEKFLELN